MFHMIKRKLAKAKANRPRRAFLHNPSLASATAFLAADDAYLSLRYRGRLAR